MRSQNTELVTIYIAPKAKVETGELQSLGGDSVKQLILPLQL